MCQPDESVRFPTPEILAALVILVSTCYAQPAASASMDIHVLDQAQRPVPGARIEATGGAQPVSALTGAGGHASLTGLRPLPYRLTLSKEGIEPVHRDVDLSVEHTAFIEITVSPAASHHESVTVNATPDTVEQGGSVPSQISGQTAREMPSRPATVAEALPLISGVVREPGGGLVISASPEHRSALVVNSADVTDPATGQFGLTVPIDSVEVLNVYQTAYLAEFGRFTAGLVSVETRRGSEKWKWELNDPLPEFRIRSYHLRGLRTATPRLNFEGPVIPGKLYISEGSEYEVRRTAVYTLPFPHNQIKQQGINTFTQLDWVASPKHLMTTTFHAAPQRLGFVGMDYFNPEPTTPDARTRNYTGTIADHLTILGSLLETTLSVTQFEAGVWARGTDGLTITPSGNRGSYFSERSQTASRVSGRSTFALPPFKRAGSHQFKIGAYFAESSEHGHVQQRPVNILDAEGQLLQRLTYPRIRQFDIADFDYAVFGQDHWTLLPQLAFDFGMRTESQQVSRAVRVAPRAGLAWTPIPDGGLTLRAGFGLFYEHVPLNVYCFNRYPDQVVTHYGPNGEIVSGPTLYLNTLGQNRVRFPFVFQTPADGNFSPRSTNWSIELEQRLRSKVTLRVRYLQNNAAGLVVLNPVLPDQNTNNGAILLSGSGGARYRQFEGTMRVRLREEREVYLSYVLSRARGDLNDFGNYLGSFPAPIVRPNQFGTLPANLPHRFLAWGTLRLPRKFRVAPTAEYRTGFPYQVTDAAQNWVGVPNKHRFPTFLSADARIYRDFQVHPKYAVRVAVSGFNLTNHLNPEAVHSNMADRQFGSFFGHRGRRYTADFDFIF